MAFVFSNPWWLDRYAWQIVSLLCLSQGLLIAGLLLQRRRRRQVEERLQRHRATAEAVIQSLPVLFYLSDETATLFRWNKAMEKVSGYTPSEIAVMKASDFIADPDQSAYQQMVQEVLATGESHVEASFLTKSGNRISYYFTEVLVRINGKPYRAGLGMDLTERKESEQALRDIQQRQQLMLNQMPAILWTIDPQLRFTSSMGAALKNLRLKPGQTNGMNLFEFFRGQECLDVSIASHKKALSGESASYELLWKDRGYTNYVEPLRNEDGVITGVIGIGLDITERRQAEEALRDAKKTAEAATRAKSEFLANMSHEIRTPLNGVMGLLELAQQTRIDPEQKELIRMARDSADALLVVLSDVLDFSKIEAGKLFLEQAEFDLAEAVAVATQTLTTRAHQKNLELSYYVSPRISWRPVGDSTRLKQVLMNLLANAIKFTERGEVVLRVENGEQTAEQATLKFSVSDTGIGIAHDQQQAIFSAFSQADNSTTRRFGGTGLGLTICARIVDMMGGRIWVESEPGKGSTFFFTAKLGVGPSQSIHQNGAEKDTEEKKNVAAVAPANSLGRLKVLLAEDNHINQEVAVRMLERMGHAVTVVATGKDAVEQIQRQRFDLVLMDVHMPEMDGYEATTAIRAWEKHRGVHTAIIATTANAMQGDREACLDAEMDGYLSKPVSRTALENAIHQAVRTDASKKSGVQSC